VTRHLWHWHPLFDTVADGGGGGTAEHLDVTGGGAADDDLDTETASLATDDGKGNKMVPLSALMDAKRGLKAANAKLKEVEPIAAKTKEVEEKLAKAQPIIDAVVNNPKLKAEAIRIATGQTRTSAATTDQPDEDEDPDAAEIAELNGYFLADGVTPDIARGRRVLNILDRRHGKQTDERIAPIAGVLVGSRAEQNLNAALAQTNDDGVPLATRESIEETVKMLGGPKSPLLANPGVVDLIINNAIGLDSRKGRTPKPPDAPLFLERQGGGRGGRDEVLSTDDRRRMTRLGLSDKDMKAAVESLSKMNSSGSVRLE
jgi:hypothetical protein